MNYSQPTRTTTRRISRILVASLLVVIMATAWAFGYPLLTSSSATVAAPTDVARNAQPQLQRAPQQAVSETAAPIDVLRSAQPGPQRPPRHAVGEAAALTNMPRSERLRSQRSPRQAVNENASPTDIPRGAHRGALGAANGVVPDGTTIFDDKIPGVVNLNPNLLGALRQAATDAADDGVTFFVTSGWRSSAYQNQLLREAVSTYGSKAKAARWVATADTSPHVSGDAVDIGPLMPRPGCSNMASSTGCARSTATNLGTTNCVQQRSITAARLCTPTRRTIPGCSDEEARRRMKDERRKPECIHSSFVFRPSSKPAK